MRELVDRAARISRGDRDAFQPLAHYGTREFAPLAHSFLDMAEQLSRRSDYIATFSSHLTHELKSPLTSIRGASELLLDLLQSKTDNLTRMEQKNFISNILGDTERLEAVTQRLRELARAETAPLNEHTELRQVIGGLKSRFPTRHRLSRTFDRHVQREGADRAVAPDRQCDSSQCEACPCSGRRRCRHCQDDGEQ